MQKIVSSEEKVDIYPVQKANFISRFLAILVDTLIIFFGGFLISMLLFSTPVADNYNAYYNRAFDIQDKYKIETGYGYKSYISDDNPLPNNYIIHEDETGKYYVKNHDEISDEIKTAWLNLLNNDQEYKDVTFYGKLHGYAIYLLSGLIVITINSLIIPLTNKRRASLGRLLAHARLINPKYYGEAKWYNVLFRYLWVVIIDFALPFYALGQFAVIVAPLLILLVAGLNKKTGRAVIDYISGTMLVPYEKNDKID